MRRRRQDPGAGEGIAQSFSFVLPDPGTDLDAEALLENTDWWLRLQSTDGGEDSAKTAAWANAVSDDVNYVVNYVRDPAALEQGAVEACGLDPDSVDFAADLAAAMTTLGDTLDLIDNNSDGILQGAEIIDAVRDVYDAAGAAGDDFDWADVKDLAQALDAMNNMPSVEAEDFLA